MHLAQETAAAKEEGNTQAMLFAMLQDQQGKQIAQMEVTNKANMDAMMEQINALVAARGGNQTPPADKENTPLGRIVTPLVSRSNPTKKSKREKALCPNCKTFLLHKPASCYELEVNKEAHYPG